MKVIKGLLATALLLGATSLASAQTKTKKHVHTSNCAAAPYAVEVKQPDGSTLQIIAKGTMLSHYVTTEDGILLSRDKKGSYYYAKSEDGKTLLPSTVLAHNATERTPAEKMLVQSSAYLAKGFQPEVAEMEEVEAQIIGGGDGRIEDALPGDAHAFPTSGKRRFLVLLINYKDTTAKYTRDRFDDLMNKPNYNNTGSFRDFYTKSSDGKLDIQVDVKGWYEADQPEPYYADTATGPDAGRNRARLLVRNAIDKAFADGVDFSVYDNDKDGYVDGILVVHTGLGAEEGGKKEYIWSHRSELGSQYYRQYNGVFISAYTIIPELRNNGSRMVGLGVVAHEFGHLLELPDLYDTEGAANGTGAWNLMASGSWRGSEDRPTSLDFWCRKQCGWVEEIYPDSSGRYSIRPSTQTTQVIRLNTPVPHEYFLLENKQLSDLDAANVGSGLAIWHINDSVMNTKRLFNRVNTDTAALGIRLVQADNKRDLEKKNNLGDKGDLFPGSTNKKAFSDQTAPSAKTRNGNFSGIRLENIAIEADSSISMDIIGRPRVAFKPLLAGQCMGVPISFENNSSFASKYLWDFGGQGTDTAKNPTFQFKQHGTIQVRLMAYNNQDTTIDSISYIVLPKAEAAIDVVVNGMNVTITETGKYGNSYVYIWGNGKINTGINKTANNRYTVPGTYTIRVISKPTSGCSDTVELQVTVDWAVGIEEQVDLTHVQVYPNPVSQTAYLDLGSITQQEQLQVTLVDAVGRVVWSMPRLKVGSSTASIDMSNLKAGLYLVVMGYKGVQRALPIVKQ